MAAPAVPLWGSKRDVCCLPHRGEGHPALGLDPEHGRSSPRSHRWGTPLGQQTLEAEGACRRFLWPSYQREGRAEDWLGCPIIADRTESSKDFSDARKGSLKFYVQSSATVSQLTVHLQRQNLKGSGTTSVANHRNLGRNQPSHSANLHLTRCEYDSNHLAVVCICVHIIPPALWQPSAVSHGNKELRRFTAIFDSGFMELNVADSPDGKKKKPRSHPKCAQPFC